MDALYTDQALVALYDTLNSSRDDFDFYTAQLPAPPARILDVGCGTGTFALELSAKGYEVTGLDPAPSMIAEARTKPNAKDVTWHVGDLSSLPAKTQVHIAVMTGHAFQCLLSDTAIATLFSQLAQHMEHDSVFLFETRNPARRPWENWVAEKAHPPYRLPNGDTIEVIHTLDRVEIPFVTFTETYRFSTGAPDRHSQSTLHFPNLAHLQTLAERCGWHIDHVWGDWTGANFTQDSPEIICRCRQK